MNGNTPVPPTPAPPTAPVAGPSASGKAITSLILGIASLPCLCCGFCTPLGVILGIVAFILGRSEEAAILRGASSPAGKTMARAGWIMGIVGIALNAIFFALTVLFWGFNARDIFHNLPRKTF